ncbi:MAG: matrixin family metalloprotease [Pseudohongiellaceae bacterium]
MSKSKTLLSSLVCILTTTISGYSAFAIEKGTIDGGIYSSEQDEFVGFASEFGIFPDGVLKLQYHHTGAPDGTTEEEVVGTLKTAFAILEGIADLEFQFLEGPDTSELGFADDLVEIYWFSEDSGVLAAAGGEASQDPALLKKYGYAPYNRGSVLFNTTKGDPLLSVTIHEILHLLGLSHSDDPVSIMRPELSRFNLPQADDIAALQAMYGQPDVFKAPEFTFNLDTPSTDHGIQIDTANSRFELDNCVDEEGFFGESSTIERLTACKDNFESVYLNLSFSGATADTKIDIYLTDSNGHTNLIDGLQVGAQDGEYAALIESYEIMSAISGDWKITVASDGRELAEFTLPVDVIPQTHNRNPTATLTTKSIGNDQFNFEVSATDPEGDDIMYSWHIPGEGETKNASSSITITAQNPNPVLAFATVQDSGIKRTGDGLDNSGFGALLSRYIVLPAEENMPTYYLQEKILHLPTLNVGGQLLSVNLKLTALPNATFKLLEYAPLSGSSGSAGAALDLNTGELIMPRVIISNNGSTSSVENISMNLVPGSVPVRFAVQL